MEPQTANPKLPLAHMAMDVVSPPPSAEKAPSNEQKPAAEKPKHAPAKKDDHAPKPPKQPGSGVGLAIFATVVIVLGLAAMATYAYLQTV